MMRSTLISSLILALLCTTACETKKPKGTAHPDEPGAAAKDGASAKGAAGEGGSPAAQGSQEGGAQAKAPAEDPTKKVCEAKVADTPTLLFAGTMLIRLPYGLVQDSLIEQSPVYQIARSYESVSCVEGVPGGEVRITALGYFDDNTKRPIKEVALELLTVQGYAGTPKLADELEKERNIEFSAEFAPDEKHPEPSKVWLALKTRFGRTYYALYEVHPNAWNALRKTLKASTDKIFLLEAEG